MLRLACCCLVALDMLRVSFHSLCVHLVQRVQRKLDIRNKCITPRTRKILSHHNPHQLEFVAMRRHSVGGNHPASFTKMVGNGEFVIVMLVFRVQAECNKWQSGTTLLAHQQEPELLKVSRQIVGSTGEIEHYGAITMLSKSNHLIVLSNDLRRTFGEIQGKRSLIRTEVVDIEHKFLGQVFGRAPYNPSYARIDLWCSLSFRRGGWLLEDIKHTRPYLCPETLIEITFSKRKSHGRFGTTNGATNPPLAAST